VDQISDKQFCQSCGMPLEVGTALGTNADGSPNSEYCEYCYKDGAYTDNSTMPEMIERCVPFVVESVGMTPDAARAMMAEMFPLLKRWQTA